MKKFILIPDSFKGTLSSIEVCDIIEEVILEYFPNAIIQKIPVADGGEGSVDAFLQAVGGEKRFVKVCGPYFEKINSFYGLIDDGSCAVIEMAAAAGLPLVGEKMDPSSTTTYGVGELIKYSIESGARKIILGLGGSSTNDGGAGCASALGVKFYDDQDLEFIPVGKTLSKIKRIDLSNRYCVLNDVEIVSMCDIDNPLYGKDGAAYVFAPQKGANQQMVELLNDNLKKLADIVEDNIGFTEWQFKGAGAAGGMGYGMKAFLDAKIQMGIEVVLDLTNFDEVIEDADYIITGEGKLDHQSLRGKVVIGVARRAKKYNKKVIAVVGNVGEGFEESYDNGVHKIVITNSDNLPFQEVIPRAKQDMIKAITKLLEDLYDSENL